MNVVTTFAPKDWPRYGKRFVDTFLLHWPKDCQLHVFLEGQPIPEGYPSVVWHDLARDQDHEEFVAKYSGPQWNDMRDFNMMSVRFSHKVFAITSPMLPATGWRVWIDADVMTHSDVEPQFDILFPPSTSLTYLGRRGMMRPGQQAYTECGFIGYNLAQAKVRALLHDMRAIYTTGKLFSLGKHNWHDSYVFDHCRQHLAFDDEDLNNLSSHCPTGMTHVWPNTVLGKCMTHNKGPRRKVEAYGK